jgi:siroheme synthase (precorrin-2 oxidase/ferrochelatase)
MLSQRITMAIADDTQAAEILAVCQNLCIMCSQVISPVATDFCCPAVVQDGHATIDQGLLLWPRNEISPTDS